MKTLNGRIVMGRSTSTRGDSWYVEIVDATSGCLAVRATMTPEQFAYAITSAVTECQFEFNDCGVVGKRREYKTEYLRRVEWVADAAKLAKAVGEAVAPYEVDGWRADRSCVTNQHKFTGDGRVAVVFHRYVAATEPKEFR